MVANPTEYIVIQLHEASGAERDLHAVREQIHQQYWYVGLSHSQTRKDSPIAPMRISTDDKSLKEMFAVPSADASSRHKTVRNLERLSPSTPPQFESCETQNVNLNEAVSNDKCHPKITQIEL